MQALANQALQAQDVTIALVDISGYTRFLVSHRKAQAHAQMIVGGLLEALLAEVGDCLEVAEIEGDAIFLYGLQQSGNPASTGDCLLRLFRAFSSAVDELGAGAICKCPACANIGALRIKAIVHSGQAVISKLGKFTKVSGIDVVAAHRLLKNSVDADEYVLVTEAARAHVAFPDDLQFERGVERYDDVGDIAVHVARDIAGPVGCARCAALPRSTSDVGYEVLRHEIRAEYAEVATTPDKGFHFHTGAKLARLLGYAEDDIAWAPACSLDSFAGTGNPHAVGAIVAGERVVDVGCGAGFDTLLAARRVGPTGRVIAVDMTPEMVERARRGAAERGLDHVTVVHGYAESLPVEDGWADVIISNGVFNLCPDKPAVLREMHRALKPGGRLQIGDILVQKPVSAAAKKNIDLWTG